MKLTRIKKLVMIIYLSLSDNGIKKAEYLKKNGRFKHFGNNNFWYPRVVPTDMELISIHDNVNVATDVYFCTHDVLHTMFNKDERIIEKLQAKSNTFKRYQGEIEIFDNVFIGAKSTIMYGVQIGPNAIVAANSVVTKSVPEGSVVAGNPAKIIGKYDDIAKKRYNYSIK